MRKIWQGILIFIMGILPIGIWGIQGELKEQNAIKGQAKISVFFSWQQKVNKDMLQSYRTRIHNELRNQGLESEGERSWSDAYSSWSDNEVQNGTRNCQVQLVGVSNDFFRFHEYKLKKGNYLGKDITKEGIVFDTNTAFSLFGSNDVVGKQVTIAGKSLSVQGVCQIEDNWYYRRGLGKQNVVFVLFPQYELLSGNEQVMNYEASIPNPVKGFAKTLVNDAIGKETDMQLIENSRRFRIPEALKRISNVTTRSVVNRQISYPYWENAARVAEDTQRISLTALIMVYILFFLLIMSGRKGK